MKKITRRTLIGLGIAVCSVIIVLIGIGLFFDVNKYKPQIEAAVEKSSGMDLDIKGKVSLKLFPHLRIALRDTHLSNRGSEVFAGESVEIAPRLLPLLFHREMVVTKLSLLSPKVRIEKSPSGRMNYETDKAKGAASEEKAGSVDDLEVRDGTLTYTDRGKGTKAEIHGINIDLSNISWNAGNELMKTLVAQGDIQMRSIKVGDKTASNFKSHVRQERGLAHFETTELEIFGGMMKGSAELDLRQPAHRMKINQKASRIDLSQAIAHAKNRASGFVDASIDLEATGNTTQALKKSAHGRVSINGQNIHLKHIDIDKVAENIKSVQGLNLVNIASIFGNPLKLPSEDMQTESVVEKLVSNWQIKDGIAKAEDVAFSTAKTTIAFKGKINLINNSYQDFFIATIDQSGCVKNKLEIAGTLFRPRPVAGSVGRQLAESHLGSAGNALGSVGSKIGGLFGSKGKTAPKTPTKDGRSVASCDLFYSGSLVQSPK